MFLTSGLSRTQYAQRISDKLRRRGRRARSGSFELPYQSLLAAERGPSRYVPNIASRCKWREKKDQETTYLLP
jgi:hypothetical protein